MRITHLHFRGQSLRLAVGDCGDVYFVANDIARILALAPGQLSGNSFSGRSCRSRGRAIHREARCFADDCAECQLQHSSQSEYYYLIRLGTLFRLDERVRLSPEQKAIFGQLLHACEASVAVVVCRSQTANLAAAGEEIDRLSCDLRKACGEIEELIMLKGQLRPLVKELLRQLDAPAAEA